MFPFSLKHRVVANVDKTTTSLINVFRRELELLEPSKLAVKGDALHFECRFFRLLNSYNFLRQISEGDIFVSRFGVKVTIVYKIKFTNMVLAVTTLVLALFTYPIWHASNQDIAEKIEILLGMWMWLVGGNYFFAAIRFNQFIRRCLI